MMCVDIAQLDPLQIYVTLTQTVIPRPITWVLSENANGSLSPWALFIFQHRLERTTIGDDLYGPKIRRASKGYS